MVWCSHLFKNFPVCFEPYTVNETDIDGFFGGEFLCFFYYPTDVGNLISGSSPFLNSACTSGSSWFMYC